MEPMLLADSPLPAFDAVWAVNLLSRVLHTVSAAALLGGLLYLKFVVAPLVTSADNADEALYRGQRAAWSRLVMYATAFLLFSGFYNLYNIIVSSEDLPGAYHMLFGIKFLLAMFVFFVAAGTAGSSPVAERMRANINKWLNMALAAAIAIFLIAAVMRSFDKVPRAIEGPEAINRSTQSNEYHG